MKGIRGIEPQVAVGTSLITYCLAPGPLTKGETVMFLIAIWVFAVFLFYGVEDQIDRFKKRKKRRQIRQMKRERRPELANIEIYRG